MILDYLPQILIASGIIALAVEITILGFATFILLFLGLGLLLTGLAMQVNFLSVDINHAMWSVSIVTFVSALLLWKPLRRMQSNQGSQKIESDFAKETFQLTEDVDKGSNDVLYLYSGINWKLRSRKPLSKGQWVKVVETEVGVLWVEPVE